MNEHFVSSLIFKHWIKVCVISLPSAQSFCLSSFKKVEWRLLCVLKATLLGSEVVPAMRSGEEASRKSPQTRLTGPHGHGERTEADIKPDFLVTQQRVRGGESTHKHASGHLHTHTHTGVTDGHQEEVPPPAKTFLIKTTPQLWTQTPSPCFCQLWTSLSALFFREHLQSEPAVVFIHTCQLLITTTPSAHQVAAATKNLALIFKHKT